MEIIELEKWSDFSSKVKFIREKYGYHIDDYEFNHPTKVKNIVLFRGVSDSEWSIETTLERKTKEKFDILKYLNHAVSCQDEIESMTGKHWERKTYDELKKEVDKRSKLPISLPLYNYLVYLRHHGFPSPLLDWTESPYVAAFFAFWDNYKKF